MPTLIHPPFVHVPIALSLLMPFVLLVAFYLIRRRGMPSTYLWGPIALQFVLFGSNVLAVWSGWKDRLFAAGELKVVVRHQNLSFIMTGLSLILLFALIQTLRSKEHHNAYLLMSLGLAITGGVLSYFVGHLGGIIAFG